MEYTYAYCRQAGGHPALALLSKAAEIHADFLSHRVPEMSYSISASWNEEAVIASYENTIVGAVSFSRSAWNRSIDIHFAYVKPEHRNKGVHSLIIREIERIAQRDGYSFLKRYVAINNSVMRSALKAQGYVEVLTTYTKPLGVRNHLEDKYCLVED